VTHWLVFACRPGKERSVAERLGQRGHLANVPLDPRAKRKRSQGNARRLVPAILGYVLVWMEDRPKAVRVVLTTEFANGETCVTRRIPGKVTAEEMQEFLAFLSALKEASPVKHSVNAGDTVRVHYGPLEGKIGTVESVKGAKVNLLIELFKVCVKAEAVELAAQHEKNDASASNSLHESANHGTRFRRDGGRFATGGKVSLRPAVLRA